MDHHDTTLFAFTIPEDEMKKEEKPAVRIAAAHTDFRVCALSRPVMS